MTAEEIKKIIDDACIKFSFIKSEGITSEIMLEDYNIAGLMILAYTIIQVLEDETGMDYNECLKDIRILCKNSSSEIRERQNE